MVAPSTTSGTRALAKTSKAANAPATSTAPQKPTPPTAETLLAFLRSSPMTPRQLADHFHCSLRDIEAALDDPDFLLAHKLQHKLAHLQSRLTAAEAVGDAVAKTVGIMQSAERPEVARRAASSLLQMAGLPTRTAAQEAPAPIPDPPVPANQSPENLRDGMDTLAAAALVLTLKRIHGLKLDELPHELDNAFAEHTRAFFDKHKLPYTWGDFTS